jgi:hypothetical protein
MNRPADLPDDLVPRRSSWTASEIASVTVGGLLLLVCAGLVVLAAVTGTFS